LSKFFLGFISKQRVLRDDDYIKEYAQNKPPSAKPNGMCFSHYTTCLKINKRHSLSGQIYILQIEMRNIKKVNKGARDLYRKGVWNRCITRRVIDGFTKCYFLAKHLPQRLNEFNLLLIAI